MRAVVVNQNAFIATGGGQRTDRPTIFVGDEVTRLHLKNGGGGLETPHVVAYGLGMGSAPRSGGCFRCRAKNCFQTYRNSSTSRPLASIMLFKVPMGMSLLPCMATITCRPFSCRHFWWLPACPTSTKLCRRRTLTTSFALQTGNRRLTARRVPSFLPLCAA